MVLERFKDLVQKAVGKQHASALYLYGRDAVLGCHGLYGAVRRSVEYQCAGSLRFEGVEQAHGYVVQLGRQHAGRMQNLGAEICQLGGLFKMERAHRRRALYKAGVVIVHTVDIGPNLDLLGVQHSPYYRGGIVAAATTQIVDSAGGIAAYVSLRDIYVGLAFNLENAVQARRYMGHVGFAARQGAHIVESGQHRNPDTLLREVGAHQGCRHKLALSENFLLAGLCERL